MAKIMTTRPRDPAEAAALKAKKPPTAPKPPKHFTALAKGPLDMLVGLMFWKLRREYPDFSMTFTEKDINGFKESLAYNEQNPKIIASAHPKFVVLRIADEKTGDMITVNENNVDDLEITEQAKKVRRYRENAPQIVSNVRSEFSQGITSQDSINQLCDAALALARA